MDGELEILKLKDGAGKNVNTTGKNVTSSSSGGGDSLGELLSVPGMRLSKKAQKKLSKVKVKMKDKTP